MPTKMPRALAGSLPLYLYLLVVLAVACGPVVRSDKRSAHTGSLIFPPLTQQLSLALDKERSIDIRLVEVNVPKFEELQVLEKDYRARYEWSMTIYCGADSTKDARVIADRAPGTLSSWRIPWPEDCDAHKNEVRLSVEANYLRCANPNIIRSAFDYAPGMMLQVDMICKESLATKPR